MKKNSARLAGVLVVAGVVAAGGIGAAVVDGGRDSADGFCARMPDSIGLYEGNPVTQMGFQVGKVERIRSVGDHVEVGFSLDGGRRFPADVEAVTRSKSILADRSLELVGNYASGPQLRAGECISLEHSYTPKSISEIAGSAADFIGELAPGDGGQSLQRAVAGFEESLRGQGQNARAMILHASAAANDPDRLIADIGSIILDMAPLTDDAMRRWASIQSILDQMPAVVAAGIGLWPGTIDVCVGVGWLVNVLHDVHTSYGDQLWPLLRGPVAEAVHLAAARSADLAGLLESIPSVAAMLRQQSGEDAALTVAYQPPAVRVDAAACEAADRLAPGTCTRSATGQPQLPVTSLLDLTIAKGAR